MEHQQVRGRRVYALEATCRQRRNSIEALGDVARGIEALGDVARTETPDDKRFQIMGASQLRQEVKDRHGES